MLNGNTLIKGRWKVIRKIGAGAFGEIYVGKNVVTSQPVAIKVERADTKKQVLKLEVAVLKKIQPSPYVCRFITCGRYGDFNFLVMELLGDNLAELRRRQPGPDGKFSLLTTLRLGIVFIKSLQQIHDFGYIHRDVKPVRFSQSAVDADALADVFVYHAQSNFVVGLAMETWGDVYIIDFGLARKYVGPDGEIKESRDQAGFRGTARYASINSHLSKDLGRRDDLWSVLYIMIEFLTGTLPWRKQKDKDRIGEIKMKFNGPELVAELPPEFLQFMNHLRGLEYSDRPDYDYLISILQSRFQKAGGTDDTLYDWQQGDHPTAAGGPGLTASQSASRVREPHGEDGEDGADENSPHHDLSDDEKSEGASPFKKPDPRRESGGRYGLGASSKAERQVSGPTSPLSSDHPFSGSTAHHSGASGHTPGVYKLVANKKIGNPNNAVPHYPSITGPSGPSNATNRRAGNDSDREDAPLKGDRGDSSEGDRAERDHDSDDSDNENHLDRSSDGEAPVKTKSSRRQRSYHSSMSDHSEESVAMGSLKAERVTVAKKRKKIPLCGCIVL